MEDMEMDYFYYRLQIKEGLIDSDYGECVIKLHYPIEECSMLGIKIKLWFKTHKIIVSIYDYDAIVKEEYDRELQYTTSL